MSLRQGCPGRLVLFLVLLGLSMSSAPVWSARWEPLPLWGLAWTPGQPVSYLLQALSQKE